EQLAVEKGGKNFDLYHGIPVRGSRGSAKIYLPFEIDAHGYGAILQLNEGELDEHLTKLLATMKDLTKKTLADLSNEWKALPQKIVEIEKTKPAKETPEGMIRIPAATKYQFKVSGIEIEGKD